jgi:hypothetical protein
MRCTPWYSCLVAAVLAAGAAAASADEGMWLFSNPPKKELQRRYDFAPPDDWYVHLQRSSVRVNSGGSGEFVSSTGLVLTNHHIGIDALEKLSTPEKNYVADGFYARTPAEEIKCPDIELNVLMSVEDVTERVNAAVRPGSSMADAEKARRAVMNTIEQESSKKTGLRSDVVMLYRGGLYQLYRYKKYTDVRLVFAPEQDMANFGGDPDNFEYPRYDLDICFFRAYENGAPAKIEHFLKWSRKGVSDSDLIFVSGHPGYSERQDTMAHLEYLRDASLPLTLNVIRRREVLLSVFSARSDEDAREAQDELLNIQNARKAEVGRLAGLQDPALMAGKAAAEAAFRQAVQRDPQLRQTCGHAWDEIAAALKTRRGTFVDEALLERGLAFNSHLFGIARTLLRLAEEDAKPNTERLREYRESNRASLEQALFSPAPLYDRFETAKLADSLTMYMELKGADDELVRKVMAGKSPADRAAELIAGTKLKDVAVRKQLAKGGAKALAAAGDPMIELARLVDAPARKFRKTGEELGEAMQQSYGKLARARFALEGTSVYPDATFTLRLAFGVVEGYVQGDERIPPWTTLAGAYRHSEAHGGRPPYALPKRWLDRKDRVDLRTPLNFLSTADIIGGNSGSPVVNRAGELVGVIFDGNLPSLVWDFIYDDKEGRAIAVDGRAIQEALRRVYGATALAKELGR